MNEELRQMIRGQLGDLALFVITQGNPHVWETEGWIYFQVNGQEVGWAINTDPVLLLVSESGKEFTNFASLMDDVCPF